jgi:arylsulfatase
MRYSLVDPEAPRQRKVQYFELEGNRGIWKDGWKAVANHVESPSFDDDIWELYDTDHDFSESNDLASRYPDKLEELKALWWHEAGKYNVLPMIESHFRTINGFDFNHLFKAPPSTDVKHYTFYPQLMPSHLAPHFGNNPFDYSAY